MVIPAYDDIAFVYVGNFLDPIEVLSKIPDLKTPSQYHDEACKIRNKYRFHDFCCEQCGVRKDSGYSDNGLT